MKIACLILAILLLIAPPAHAQFGGASGVDGRDATATEIAAGKSIAQRWKIGFSVRAANANCAGVFATVPVPTDWPEQSVQIVEELTDVSPQVKKVDFRVLGSGVKQLLASIPVLRSGEEAHVFVTFEVIKRIVVAPEDVTLLRIPQGLSRDFRPYLGSSPFIESTNRRIKDVAKKAVAGKNGAWAKAEAIYDWVREHVEYKDGKLKGALAALKDGNGDCEELTSLFVAMCRANRIPARTVWIQGHCYPEFYLEDDQGEGRWYPCQAAGTRNFGGMFDKRLILQKGDKFKVPEKKADQRYVAEFLSAKSVRGSGGPQVTFVRELVLGE
ncbi:MAG: transglutaminase-like domain-containing protein [Pirellulaceae bacterium]|nr:transglutaminase-like domain-containing protein [Pirellulaceae bacterium]HJN10732.1 transglutaminase-like domain-containing protein [Pirellulaceae bacterium]